MQNEEGQITELYIPRKCSATNRLITAKDHASVQINIGHLDENGIYNGHFSTFALCGFIRAQVETRDGTKEDDDIVEVLETDFPWRCHCHC
ncbi:40S ribosomal protein S21-2-like isoform X1 [Prosopis cineraria]|uniref:40S ribosomal protein S21-2-like isoform X1 n=1 Tax=Prosopis cineraria TaxID=364024 RepID=UPI002410451A|nr:40S ribosomal protein S21-2-like isoform X1 [Prosopis cineraria]